MPRKPVSVSVKGEGDARHLVLTYGNGDVVRREINLDSKPTRKPRRPVSRVKIKRVVSNSD